MSIGPTALLELRPYTVAIVPGFAGFERDCATLSLRHCINWSTAGTVRRVHAMCNDGMSPPSAFRCQPRLLIWSPTS